MSLLSQWEGITSGFILRRHMICFVKDLSDISPVEKILNRINPRIKTQFYEKIDESFIKNTKAEDGVVLVLFGAMDKKLQGNFGTWLYHFRGNLVMISDGSCDIIPYLRHQFWFACGMNSGEALSLDLSLLPSIPDLVDQIHVHHSIRRYVLDIIVHLRMHRLSRASHAGGVHTRSLQDMVLLCKWVAYLKGYTFVTPEMVQTAAKQYFPWHLQLIEESKHDASTMYGSQPELVDELIDRFSKFGVKSGEEFGNPLFKELLVVENVLSKVVPAT